MDDRGGPLVKVIDEKVTVIGLGSNTGPIPAESWKYFFDLGGYRNEICAISGVCPEEQTTEAEEATTTSASTLETTDSTSGNDSTAPPVSSNPSQKPISFQNETTEEPNRSIDEYAVAEEDIKVNEYVAETHIYANPKFHFGTSYFDFHTRSLIQPIKRMKIRIQLYLLVLTLEYTNSWKLTPEENNQRLEECGRKFNSRPTNHASNEAVVEHSHNDWIVRVQSIGGKHQLFPTTGSFISPRHIITSVQSVITENREWGYNGQKFLSNCTHLSRDFEIPKKVVDHILITRGKCGKKNCDQEHIRAEKAFVLDFCEHEHFDRMFRIMVIEVKNYVTNNFACVADETHRSKKGETVEIYGFDGKSLIYRLRQISNVHDDYLLTSKYYVKGDRGGPMIKNIDGRETIIGIGASTGFNDNSGETFFFKLSSRFHSLCDLIGICKWKKLPPKSSSTSTIKTTPVSSTSVTISLKNEQSNSSMTSKIIPTSTENPMIHPSTDCQFAREEDEGEELDDGKSDEVDLLEKNTRSIAFFGVYLLTCFYLFS
ncbi:unnamed protein product [Caenorhabditis brenneri]